MSTHPLAIPTPEEIDIKKRFQTLTSEEFASLKKAQRYQQAIALLRETGWLNLFLGVFDIWLGLRCCELNAPHLFQIVGGTVLIGFSLWSIALPSLKLTIWLSVILLVFGLWNIFISLYYGIALLGILIGVVQIWWAYRVYMGHRANQRETIIVPDSSILTLYEALLKGFRRARMKTDNDIIELNLKRYRWQAWLLGEYSVFAPRQNLKRFILVEKSKVDFAPEQEAWSSRKRIKGTFKIDHLVSWGNIHASSLGRYRQWKTLEDTSAEFVTTYYEKQRIPLLAAKIVRTFTILFLIAVVLFVGWMIWLVLTYW